MKRLFYSLALLLCALSSEAQFGTITFNQDTVVIVRRLKIMTLRPGSTGDSIIVHKANGNIGAMHMNQITIPWANITSQPTIPTNNNQLTNGMNFITGINSTMVDNALGYVAYDGSSNPLGFVNQTGARTAISAGAGINYNNGTGVVTNSAPDQTVVLTGNNGITTSGTYPNFTIAKTKRQETYTGSTNASGNYTVTFGTAYSVAPNVIVTPISGVVTESWVVTTSTTGFTVNVKNRVDVVGLLPSFNNVNGRTVDVLVTEK